jgi:hypothetical protein
MTAQLAAQVLRETGDFKDMRVQPDLLVMLEFRVHKEQKVLRASKV